MSAAAQVKEFTATTATEQLLGGVSVVHGWSVTETTGSADAECELRDGTEDGGALIANITLSGNESIRDVVPAPGIGALVGVRLVVLAGSVKGSVWHSPATLIDGIAVTIGVKPVWGGGE